MLQSRGRWTLTILLVAGIVLGAVSLPSAAKAAPPSQGRLSFDDETGMTGTLDNNTPKATYSFDCVENGVGSVRVETTSGDLSTSVNVLDASGAALAAGVQVSTNPDVSVAEAFTMPSAGTCSVELTRAGSTSGGYTVRLLPGFAQLDKWDKFDGSSGPLALNWAESNDTDYTAALVNQELQIKVMKASLIVHKIAEDAVDMNDFYAQADVTVEGNPSYAEYGFAFRLTTSSDGTNAYYTFTFSTYGDYAVFYYNGNWQTIQDWTTSSLVDKTNIHARVGVLVQGHTFKAYYNGQFVGEVTDPNQYASTGLLGLVASTTKDQTDTLVVDYDNLVITVPSATGSSLPFGGTGATPSATPPPAGGLLGILGSGTKPPEPTPTHAFALPTVPPAPTPASIIPTTPPSTGESLASWNSGTPQDIVNELHQLGHVPAGGSQVLNVPSSYGDTSTSGWSYFSLAKGNTYRNFVLAFDTREIFGAEGAGCGMYFRETSSTSNDAVITSDGSALLGEWDSQGNMTKASVYDKFSAINSGVGATNRIVVVAQEGTVMMYVNGQLFANATFAPQSGAVALEMYVPSDSSGKTQETYCQLNNIWMWGY